MTKIVGLKQIFLNWQLLNKWKTNLQVVIKEQKSTTFIVRGMK